MSPTLKLSPAHKHVQGFAKAADQVFALSQVVHADFSAIEQLRVHVQLTTGSCLMLTDIDALELAMRLKPSVLESRRFRWPRWAWMLHNLVGHPVMQVLALLRCYRAAFWVHDATVPRPLGPKQR